MISIIFLIAPHLLLSPLLLGSMKEKEVKIFDSAAVIKKGKLIGIQRKHYLYHQYFNLAIDFLFFTANESLLGL